MVPCMSVLIDAVTSLNTGLSIGDSNQNESIREYLQKGCISDYWQLRAQITFYNF